MKDKLIELIKFSLNDKTKYKTNLNYFPIFYHKSYIREYVDSRIVYKNKDNKEVTLGLETDVEFYYGLETEVVFNQKPDTNKWLDTFKVEISFETEPSIIIRTEKVTPKSNETTNTLINGFRYNKLFNFKLSKKPIVGVYKVSYAKLKYIISCDSFEYEIDEELMVEFYNLAVENGNRFQDQEYLDVINDRLQKYKDR